MLTASKVGQLNEQAGDRLVSFSPARESLTKRPTLSGLVKGIEAMAVIAVATAGSYAWCDLSNDPLGHSSIPLLADYQAIQKFELSLSQHRKSDPSLREESSGRKSGCTKGEVLFLAFMDECTTVKSSASKMVMTTAALVKVVRDHVAVKFIFPGSKVAIKSVRRNLDRTLLKVRWHAGGDCVVFPEDLDKNLHDIVSG